MKRAIIPGTFDPPHHGHVDILYQAMNLFDEVHWVILANPNKSTKYDITTRLAAMRQVSKHLQGVQVRTMKGMLVDAALGLECTHIVRSIRNGFDLEYENAMARVNRELAPGLETVYLPARQHLSHVSSSLVRELIHNVERGHLGWTCLRPYLHTDVIDILRLKNNHTLTCMSHQGEWPLTCVCQP